MPQAVQAAVREALRHAGLAGQGVLARLLALLGASAETHLRREDVARLAAEAGLALPMPELDRHLDTLVAHGLLRRLPSIGAEPVFDTVARPHSHLVYEDTAQTVDLDVSPETLLAILRQALAERPDGVEIMMFIRRPATAPAPEQRGAGG